MTGNYREGNAYDDNTTQRNYFRVFFHYLSLLKRETLHFCWDQALSRDLIVRVKIDIGGIAKVNSTAAVWLHEFVWRTARQSWPI